MDRQIKFRGKRIDNEEWVVGDLVRFPKDYGSYNEPPSLELTTFITEANTLNKNPIPVIPESVGQFTEYKDKHGKEIYEGHLIRIKHFITHIKPRGMMGKLQRIVDENDPLFEYGKTEKISYILEVKIPDIYMFWADKMEEFNTKKEAINCIEIIGNTTDNPELLNGRP